MNRSGAAVETNKRKKRSGRCSVQAGWLGAYRAARLRLKVRLQVQGRVEIAAGVAAAAALHGVHAHRDAAVVVRHDRRRRVREPALGLHALARAALVLAAHLCNHQPPPAQRPRARTAPDPSCYRLPPTSYRLPARPPTLTRLSCRIYCSYQFWRNIQLPDA